MVSGVADAEVTAWPSTPLSRLRKAAGAIAPSDLELLSFTDDPEEAAEMATRPLPLKVEKARARTGEPKRDV